jgi:hypothetical protein
MIYSSLLAPSCLRMYSRNVNWLLPFSSSLSSLEEKEEEPDFDLISIVKGNIG